MHAQKGCKPKEGGLSASDKRGLIVKWVDQAWREMQTERMHCINSAFVSTGVLIARNGSEDRLIRLRPKDEPGMYTYK